MLHFSCLVVYAVQTPPPLIRRLRAPFSRILGEGGPRGAVDEGWRRLYCTKDNRIHQQYFL